MNQEVKTKWVEELRSGKYKQTTGKLHDKRGHCCLGVLCEIYMEEKKLEWNSFSEFTNAMRFLTEDGKAEEDLLPDEVRQWAGLEDSDPAVVTNLDDDDEEGTGEYSLSEINDLGKSFSYIADIIEKEL